MNEPSLYSQAQTKPSKTTLRLTLLPAFSDPLVVRIDDIHGTRPRLTATLYKGQVVTIGDSRVTRDLTADDIQPLRSLLASTQVLSLSPDSCLSGPDGFIYVIEAAGPDGYRFINRWGAMEKPVYDVAQEMYRLTGWSHAPQGITQ